MKTLLVLDKAELLTLMRDSSPVDDDDEAGNVIEGLSNALRELAKDHEDEIHDLRAEHESAATVLLEETCEASGFPVELLFFLLDFKLLIDLVESDVAEREWRDNRGKNNVIVMKKRAR